MNQNHIEQCSTLSDAKNWVSVMAQQWGEAYIVSKDGAYAVTASIAKQRQLIMGGWKAHSYLNTSDYEAQAGG